jgi:DNA-binding NarL/FixJ family response regulator
MQSDKTVRVLICSKYTLFREGIKALLPLGTHIEIVGEAATPRRALNLLEHLRPHAVLMDVTNGGSTGSEATRRIKAIDPGIEVLVLSLIDDELLISECLKAGATAHVRKHDRAVQLKRAIHSACKRGTRAA